MTDYYQRHIWLDWMKVLSMYFILWGHLFPEGLCSFIYSFSVPVFFVISGYLTKVVDNPVHACKKTFKGLVIPYLLIVLSNIVIYAAMAKSIPGDWQEKLFGLLIGLQPYIGAMWFVYTLIIIKVILILLNLISKREHTMFIMLSAVCVACVFLMIWWNTLDYEEITQPISEEWPSLSVLYKGKVTWAYTNVFAAFPFFYAGLLMKYWGIIEKGDDLIRNHKMMAVVISLLLTFLLYILSAINGPVWMYLCEYGNNIFLCYLNVLIACLVLYISSTLLQSMCTSFVKIMSVGNIIVLGYHGIPLNITMLKAPCITTLGGEIVGTMCFALVLYLLFYPIVLLVSKYIPILIGSRKL